MSQSQSLVDFLVRLIRDGGQRAEFSVDPAAAFARHGISDPSPRSIYEALVLIGDDQDLGRSTDVLHVPPPPPPAYFGDHHLDGAGAGARYLDNYVSSGFDDDQGPFTGSSDAHGIDPVTGSTDHGYDHQVDDGVDDGTDHAAGYGTYTDHTEPGLDQTHDTDFGGDPH
jgi:hypothetical protein